MITIKIRQKSRGHKDFEAYKVGKYLAVFRSRRGGKSGWGVGHIAAQVTAGNFLFKTMREAKRFSLALEVNIDMSQSPAHYRALPLAEKDRLRKIADDCYHDALE